MLEERRQKEEGGEKSEHVNVNVNVKKEAAAATAELAPLSPEQQARGQAIDLFEKAPSETGIAELRGLLDRHETIKTEFQERLVAFELEFMNQKLVEQGLEPVKCAEDYHEKQRVMQLLNGEATLSVLAELDPLLKDGGEEFDTQYTAFKLKAMNHDLDAKGLGPVKREKGYHAKLAIHAAITARPVSFEGLEKVDAELKSHPVVAPAFEEVRNEYINELESWVRSVIIPRKVFVNGKKGKQMTMTVAGWLEQLEKNKAGIVDFDQRFWSLETEIPYLHRAAAFASESLGLPVSQAQFEELCKTQSSCMAEAVLSRKDLEGQLDLHSALAISMTNMVSRKGILDVFAEKGVMPSLALIKRLGDESPEDRSMIGRVMNLPMGLAQFEAILHFYEISDTLKRIAWKKVLSMRDVGNARAEQVCKWMAEGRALGCSTVVLQDRLMQGWQAAEAAGADLATSLANEEARASRLEAKCENANLMQKIDWQLQGHDPIEDRAVVVERLRQLRAEIDPISRASEPCYQAALRTLVYKIVNLSAQSDRLLLNDTLTTALQYMSVVSAHFSNGAEQDQRIPASLQGIAADIKAQRNLVQSNQLISNAIILADASMPPVQL